MFFHYLCDRFYTHSNFFFMKPNYRQLKLLLAISALFIFELTAVSQSESPKSSNSSPALETYSTSGIPQSSLRRSSSIMQIADPDADYVSNTTLMDISDIPDRSDATFLTSDGFTLTFDVTLQKGSVPNTWSSWNSPPNSETASPHILASTIQNLSIEFSEPIMVFGFEAESNDFDICNLSLDLYNGSTLLKSIVLPVTGDYGSRLFAAQSNSLPFTRAEVKILSSKKGFAIANLRFSRTVYIQPETIPVIINDLSDAVICKGSSHTFTIGVEGDNLTYQWYKGNNLIQGVRGNTLTISDATKSDYEFYYVKIKNDGGTTYSKKVRLWVADPLPTQLKLSEYPDHANIGKTYLVAIEGYPDVTKYTWSYSLKGATFKSSQLSDRDEAEVIFSEEAVGHGKIILEMEHICGNRTVTSENILVRYPTGIDDIFADVQVSVYPNPVKNMLNIKSNALKINQIELINSSGQSMYKNQGSNQGNTSTINTLGWTKGTYILKIVTDKGIITRKILKN